MKLVLQRAAGDCGIAAIATLIEQTYEDVYVATAKIERKARGRSGIHLADLIRIGKALGITLVRKREPVALDDDEGLLVVQWRKGSPHQIKLPHLVVLAAGVIVDPADGVILPADEYLARELARADSFLELR